MNTKIRKALYIIITLILITIIRSLEKHIGQFAADTIINIILIVSVMLLDTISCVLLSIIAPFIVKLLGITNIPISMLAVIALSNIMFITVYTVAFQLFASQSIYQKVFTWGVSALISAFLKFEILYLIADKFLMNILEINSQITYNFGAIQFWTALFAGLIVSFIIKPIENKLNR